MKELVFEELSLKQKLGMTFTAFLNAWSCAIEDNGFVFDLIKERALGAVWIQHGFGDADELIKKVREIADYPILILTDAEKGIGDFMTGNHSAIAATGDEKYAYAFGKVVGATAKKCGYSVVCNPLLDMTRGGIRSLGNNKDKVAKFAAAIARGMHDGGVLTLGKHYPGGKEKGDIDPHMAESYSENTVEELIEYDLYPYKKLMEQNLLDGLMTSHKRFVNIDPERPASLSKPVIDIIRDMGFEGIAITDALNMMGIAAKYSCVEAYGYAKAAGNDLILPFKQNTSVKFSEFCEAYEKGLFDEAALDASVKRVLEAQHKSTLLPQNPEITPEEAELFKKINAASVYAEVDEGIKPSIDRDKKCFFGIMVSNDLRLDDNAKPEVDTFSSKWHFPIEMEKQLKSKFPNCIVRFFSEFPSQKSNYDILQESADCDETIFFTFTEPLCYTGNLWFEHLTRRFVKLVEAMQITNRVTGIVHFGNPTVIEELEHVPRRIFGGLSKASVETCINVLAGDAEPVGIPNCEINLK